MIERNTEGPSIITASLPSVSRWAADEDGILKPVISRVHVIPIENRESLLHCAQLTCWCSPQLDRDDDCLVLHQSMTTAEHGWVLIGELEHWLPAHALPLPEVK